MRGHLRRALFAGTVAAVAAPGCLAPERPLELDTPLERRAPKLPPHLSEPPRAPTVPAPEPHPEPSDAPLPINLATALQLGNARPLDVQIAGRQVRAAVAAHDRARLLWVPNVAVGLDYFKHTGPQQNFAGDILSSNRNTLMAGFGPNVVFAFTDAVYAPLAAKQDLRARQAGQQTAINDSVLAVAEAYFNVQQARGDLAGALAAETKAEEVAKKTAELAKGLAPPSEEHRARVELGRRKQAVASARERWRVSSAELARVLRMDPAAVFEPAEPATLPVTVIDPSAGLDELIPVALNARPELATHQAFVQATLARLKQEKMRPLVPSLAVRSVSTNPSGSLGYGAFGGGAGGALRNFDGRFDIDVQLLWEFSAIGLGNRARVMERRAEHEAAALELFRTQDRIAAEVAARFAEARAAAQRVNDAEPALKEAIELVRKTNDGLGQTRRLGDALVLVVRPQEAVAALQAFAQANTDFFAAVADYNRAQFRLYRALGHPAQCLAGAVPTVSVAPPAPPVPPVPDVRAEPPPLPVARAAEPKPLPTKLPEARPVRPASEWQPIAPPAVSVDPR